MPRRHAAASALECLPTPSFFTPTHHDVSATKRGRTQPDQRPVLAPK